MATYNPKEVVVSIGGLDISGYADGTFISAEMTEDAYQMATGADGNTDRVRLNDNSGTVTITLQQTSSSNDKLSAIYALDTGTGSGIVPLFIKDFSGTTLISSPKVWIRKLPPVAFDKSIGTREWMIDCENLIMFVGGNNV